MHNPLTMAPTLRWAVVVVFSTAATVLTAPAASADPNQPPPCEAHQHPETHHCRVYYDDPFGVWESEVEHELLGV